MALNRGHADVSSPGSATTLNVTDGNFGGVNAKAGVFFGNNGAPNSTVASESWMFSIGDDNLDNYCVGGRARDNQANTQTKSLYQESIDYRTAESGAPDPQNQASIQAAINNGFRFNYSTSSATEQIYGFMLGGTAIANHGVIQIASGQSVGTHTINSLGFTPDLLIAMASRNYSPNSSESAHEYCQVGITVNGLNGVKRRCIASGRQDNQATSVEQSITLSNTFSLIDMQYGGFIISTSTFQNFGGSGDFDLVVASGATAGPISILGIKFASGYSCDIVDITLPASTGNFDTSVSGLFPRVLLNILSRLTSFSTVTSGVQTEAFGFATFVENGGSVSGSSISMVSEDNVTTTDTYQTQEDDSMVVSTNTGSDAYDIDTPVFTRENIRFNASATSSGVIIPTLVIGDTGVRKDFMPFFYE